MQFAQRKRRIANYLNDASNKDVPNARSSVSSQITWGGRLVINFSGTGEISSATALRLRVMREGKSIGDGKTVV